MVGVVVLLFLKGREREIKRERDIRRERDIGRERETKEKAT